MNTIDIIILVFALIGAYYGFKKGLLMEIISLGAFFMAIIVAIKLLDWSVEFLSEFITGFDKLLPIGVFALIFIGVIILLTYLGNWLKQLIDMTLLGNLDNIAGAMMGMVKWALFFSIVIWIYESIGGKISDETTETSYLYEPVSAFAPSLFALISGLFPHILEFFERSKEFVSPEEVGV